MLLTLGLTGLPYSGADVGGFFGNPDAELMTRWVRGEGFIPLCGLCSCAICCTLLLDEHVTSSVGIDGGKEYQHYCVHGGEDHEYRRAW